MSASPKTCHRGCAAGVVACRSRGTRSTRSSFALRGFASEAVLFAGRQVRDQRRKLRMQSRSVLPLTVLAAAIWAVSALSALMFGAAHIPATDAMG